jgi:hypothetical protein
MLANFVKATVLWIVRIALPETKSSNLRTEAHSSGLELKFACYIFYIGNPNVYVLPRISRNPRYLYKSVIIKCFGHIAHRVVLEN